MASRSRGDKVKGDLSNLPLVRHIPSKAMVSDRMQPIYYEMLHSLAGQELDIIQQSLAILISRHYVTMLEILLYRDKVKNEADVPAYKYPLDDLDKTTKSYSELVKVFYAISRQNKPKEEEEPESMDMATMLQSELSKLRNDGDCPVSREE